MIWAGGQRNHKRKEKNKKCTMVAESDTRMGVTNREREAAYVAVPVIDIMSLV